MIVIDPIYQRATEGRNVGYSELDVQRAGLRDALTQQLHAEDSVWLTQNINDEGRSSRQPFGRPLNDIVVQGHRLQASRAIAGSSSVYVDTWLLTVSRAPEFITFFELTPTPDGKAFAEWVGWISRQAAVDATRILNAAGRLVQVSREALNTSVTCLVEQLQEPPQSQDSIASSQAACHETRKRLVLSAESYKEIEVFQHLIDCDDCARWHMLALPFLKTFRAELVRVYRAASGRSVVEKPSIDAAVFDETWQPLDVKLEYTGMRQADLRFGSHFFVRTARGVRMDAEAVRIYFVSPDRAALLKEGCPNDRGEMTNGFPVNAETTETIESCPWVQVPVRNNSFEYEVESDYFQGRIGFPEGGALIVRLVRS